LAETAQFRQNLLDVKVHNKPTSTPGLRREEQIALRNLTLVADALLLNVMYNHAHY
jgi:hypothetical protein